MRTAPQPRGSNVTIGVDRMIVDVLGVALRASIFTALIAGGALFVDRPAFVGAPLASRLGYVARTRWPYAIFVLTMVAADVATQLLPEPRGHWSGHAMTAFLQLGVGAAIVATGVLSRRVGVVLLLAALVLVGLGIAAKGNWAVAESIWKTSHGDTSVSAAVALDPAGYTSGHDAAGTGELITWVAGIAFVVLVGATRKVQPRTAVIGCLLAILPPWMFGGVGAWFVLAHVAVERRRARYPPPEAATRLPIAIPPER